jgi:hypothetical protein
MICPHCKRDTERPEDHCFVSGCEKLPKYETYARNHDGLGLPTGLVFLVRVCEEHTSHPWLCANQKKPEKSDGKSST